MITGNYCMTIQSHAGLIVISRHKKDNYIVNLISGFYLPTFKHLDEIILYALSWFGCQG